MEASRRSRQRCRVTGGPGELGTLRRTL
jgi:hypothetical protein